MYIEDQLRDYPEFLRSKQLVELGIYINENAVWSAVHFDVAPPRIRINRKHTVFPKADLIKWLQTREESRSVHPKRTGRPKSKDKNGKEKES